MLQELESRRKELMREVRAVAAAIEAYAKTIGKGSTRVKKVAATKLGKRRHMSAATKRKLSLAAKARWAKVKKVKKEAA